MTVNELMEHIDASLICGETDKIFDGVYVGDLLSRAMSHVEADNLFVTIMANTNTVAVASLTEAAAVVLAENVKLPEDALEAANKNGITVISSTLSAFELCVRINNFIMGEGA